MTSRIENVSGGKYLYIQQEADDNGYELKMAASMISESIITPTQVFAYGGMCLEYCITGLKELENYLSDIRLNSKDIIRLLAQIEQSVNTVKNYLLSEADLLINADYIYVDEERGQLKLCIVPGYNGAFEDELKAFISKLLIHIDAADDAALKLGFKLFKTISDREFRLHDIMGVLGQRNIKAAAGRSNFEFDRSEFKQRIQYNDNEQEACMGADLKFTNQDEQAYSVYQGTGYEYKENEYGSIQTECDETSYNQSGSVPDADADAEETIKPHSILRETLSGLAVSQGILITVAIAVFLLKGRSTVMRLLPVYLVIAVCVAVYYAASFALKRRRQ